MPTDESMEAAFQVRVDWQTMDPNDLQRITATALDAAYERGRAEERARCARIAKSAWLTAGGKITDADHDAALCEAIENAIKGDTP